MSDQQSHQGGDFISDTQNAIAIGGAVAQVWALPWEAALHHSFGSRYLGGNALLVVPLTWCYCLFWRRADLWPMMYFLGVFFLLCLIHNNSRRLRSWWRPETGHSRYTGVPWLWRFLPWLSEVSFKRYVEPLIGGAIGAAVCVWSEPLGVFLMISAFCLAATCAESVAQDHRRVADLNDSVIEQQYIAERFRDRRGDRY